MSRFQREYGWHLVDEVRSGRLSRADLLRRATVFGLSASSVATLLAACGGSSSSSGEGGGLTTQTGAAPAAGQPRKGGTLRVASAVPTADIDPVTMYDAGSIATVQQVCEYLAWVETDFTLRPVLAESWQPSADAKTWTFKLRRGVSFNDGSPFGADDVVATFDRLTNPDSQSAALSNFKGILSSGNVEKTDDSTVVFHLDRAFADFPYMVSSTNYNAVVLPKAYDGGFMQKPVGTGPFTVAQYTQKQRVSFAPNPSYWQEGLPYLESVQIVFYADDQAQLVAIQGGAVDAMLTTPLQGSEPLASDPALKLLETKGTGWYELHMRVDQDPWTDKRVRQAMALAVDRQQMVDSLQKGHADLGNDHMFAPAFPVSKAVSAKVPQRTQDLERAKQLLADAGKGSGFSAQLTVEQAGPVPNMAVLFKQDVSQIGVTIDVKVISQTAYYGSGSNQPWLEVPAGIVDWAARAIPSQFILPAFTCDGIWNSAHWCNQEFDRLAKSYDATVDESRRTDIAVQMATIQNDETPAIAAFWTGGLRAMKKEVQNLVADASSFLDLTKTWISS